MPTLDIFNNDGFSVQSLTAGINDMPYTPSLLSMLGIFGEDSLTTTTFSIEKRGLALGLVTAAQRGNNRSNVMGNDKAQLIPFSTVHLPQSGAVLADEVQNVRTFGSESELATVQSIVNRKLLKMKMQLDLTIEYQRIGAIKGQVLDSDGTTVLLDVLGAFGVTQTTHAFNIATSTTKMKTMCNQAARKVESALGAFRYSGLLALCGKTWFDDFVSHASVERAYDNFTDRTILRDVQRNQDGSDPGFVFSNIQFREYKGGVGATPFIADNEAYLIPLGVPELFKTYYAPADYMETVNTQGLPYYAKQERMRMDKGVELEAQSNPISLCTRPGAIVKLSY